MAWYSSANRFSSIIVEWNGKFPYASFIIPSASCEFMSLLLNFQLAIDISFSLDVLIDTPITCQNKKGQEHQFPCN